MRVTEQFNNNNYGDLYTHLINPNFGRILKSVNMLEAFESGKGEYLYYSKNGEKIKCLDFLTNFGPDFFGINNEKLLNVAKNFFDSSSVNLCNASVPASAAVLADRLNRMTGKLTPGKNYVVKFANSGAEGVEVAFKVAELYKHKQIEIVVEKSRSNIQRAKREMAEGCVFSDGFIAKISQLLNSKRFYPIIEKQQLDISACSPDQILDFIHAVNEHILLDSELVTVALEKGFHGKTHGALRATYREEYREPYQRYLSKTLFVTPNSVASLTDVFKSQIDVYYIIKFQDGQLHLQEREWLKISSIIVEPVLGEGGAFVLDKAFLQSCRDLAEQHDIVFILDEVQCGLGRTGYFLSPEWSGVEGAIYILSKQLGGGVAKISATIIDTKYYDKDHDILNHSSTFNEDNFSSQIALEVLNLYENDRIQERVLKIGAYLKNRLIALQQEFPEVIENVTGMGLLLGVHIADQSASYSSFIRGFSELESLGAVIIAYLFNVFQIRVFVTTANEEPVIRLQPCAYISEEQCDQVVAALRHVCIILSRDNAYELLKFLTGHTEPAKHEEIEDFSHLRTPAAANIEQEIRQSKNTAFMLLHILDHTHPKKYLDDSLRKFTDDEMTFLIEKFYGVSDDVYIEKHETRKITSQSGAEVLLVPIYTMIGPGKIKAALKSAKTGDNNSLRYLLRIAENAKQEVIDFGGTALGYGGYWSIVAQYGTGYQDKQFFVPAFQDEGRIKQTTGNTFTAHITALAIKEAITKLRAADDKVTLAAIGINGNICSSTALSLLKDVDQIIAVGSSLTSTKRSGIAICHYLLEMILKKGQIQGVAKSLLEIDSVREVLEKDDFKKDFQTAFAENNQVRLHQLGEAIFNLLNNETQAPVRISDDPKWSVKNANVIFTATNSPNVLLFKDDMPTEQDKEIYIIDTSTPHNVDKAVNEFPHIHRRGGGLVTTASKQPLIFKGTDINDEDLFACIAETLLIAADEHAKPSAGAISIEDLENIAQAGEKFGFILSENEGKHDIFGEM